MGGRRGRLISSDAREQALGLISEACSNGARKFKACKILGLSIRTVERWEKPSGTVDKRKTAYRPEAHNAIKGDDKMVLMNIVNSKEFQNLPPCKIIPLLADNDCYIASESTIYRILRKEKQLAHRLQSKPKKHNKPKPFVAIGPNQVWSWDISYLPTTVKGLYFYLYMILDIYSRKIVGWSIHEQQCADYSSKLITQSCLDENIDKSKLVLHSDNGKPMKAATMLATLEKLGVRPSFSRPSVSDDNAYSESLFKTVKYHSTYPAADKFDTIIDARGWMEKFVFWYNNKHLHSGIKFVTPNQRHSGEDVKILQNRHRVYQKAKVRTPNRWSGKTRNWDHNPVVLLNSNHVKSAVSEMLEARSNADTRSKNASVTGVAIAN